MNFNNLTSMAIFCDFTFHNNGHDNQTTRTGELIPARLDSFPLDYAVCGSPARTHYVETYMPSKCYLQYQTEIGRQGDEYFYYPKGFYDYYDGLMYEFHVKFRIDFMIFLKGQMYIELQDEILRYRQWNDFNNADRHMVELFRREIDKYLTYELQKLTTYDCRIVENVIENIDYRSDYHAYNNSDIDSNLYTIILSGQAVDDLLINEKLSILDNDSSNFLDILQLLHNNKGLFNGT